MAGTAAAEQKPTLTRNSDVKLQCLDVPNVKMNPAMPTNVATESTFSQKGNGLNRVACIHSNESFCCKYGAEASYRNGSGLLNRKAEIMSVADGAP